MSAALLPCVELPPAGGAATCAVIWMHGLGADGHDFEPIVPYLGLPEDLGVRFVFPHAPRRAVSINMGLLMPAWYDLRALDAGRDEDERGIRESAAQIGALVAREAARGIPPERIVLAGFSQGGAMALHVALRHPDRLAGVVALSCYLIGEGSLDRERSAANQGLPIFQAHGTDDPIVPLPLGLATRDRLAGLGYDVEWRTYEMRHQVVPEEIEAIGGFLRRVLGSAPAPAPAR
ncbi:MAG: alpha/beta hydrolase [Candidatus Polarisedimenticolia bacterium]